VNDKRNIPEKNRETTAVKRARVGKKMRLTTIRVGKRPQHGSSKPTEWDRHKPDHYRMTFNRPDFH
jgi:hypothetical protein